MRFRLSLHRGVIDLGGKKNPRLYITHTQRFVLRNCFQIHQHIHLCIGILLRRDFPLALNLSSPDGPFYTYAKAVGGECQTMERNTQSPLILIVLMKRQEVGVWLARYNKAMTTV
jgi:hypothetical protein